MGLLIIALKSAVNKDMLYQNLLKQTLVVYESRYESKVSLHFELIFLTILGVSLSMALSSLVLDSYSASRCPLSSISSME